jgi:4-aminobutyrate aminotransferase-like enzyme
LTIALTRCEGSYCFDESGHPYLDLIAGWGMCILGWQPASVIEAVTRQLREAAFEPPGDSSDLRRKLEVCLLRVFGLTDEFAVLPALSGSEAVDIALRLARRRTGRTDVVSVDRAYHGNTLAALSLCSMDGWYSPVEHEGFKTLRFPINALTSSDIGAMEAFLNALPNPPSALILEPLQTNGGFRLLNRDVISLLRHYCDRHGTVFIADEVGGGFGRGGTWLGIQNFDIMPDVMVLGKAMSAGVYPLAAVVARVEIAQLAEAPGFRSTFAWTPPGCVAALATIDALEVLQLPQRAKRLRECNADLLEDIARLSIVREVTGLGLGIGIGLVEDGRRPPTRLTVRKRLLDRGVYVEATPNLPGLVLMPALTVPEDDLRSGLIKIRDTLAETIA